MVQTGQKRKSTAICLFWISGPKTAHWRAALAHNGTSTHFNEQRNNSPPCRFPQAASFGGGVSYWCKASMAAPIETLEETVKKKLQSKYNVKLEVEIKEWLEQLLGKKFDANTSFQENLKDGVILCEYVN